MAESEFKLPDVGEGLTEAEMVTWMVKVGDTIKVNDIICEIETAKSLVELPSPYAGTVTRLMVSEGETVAVGTPIIAVSSGAPAGRLDGGTGRGAAEVVDDESSVERPPADQAVEPGMIGSPAPIADGATPTLVGYGPRTAETTRRRRTGAASAAAPPVQATAPAAAVRRRRRLPRSTATASGDARGARQTAGAQAGEGPGRRPRSRRPDRPGRHHHARRRARPGPKVAPLPRKSPVPPSHRQLPVQPGERETRVAIKGVRKMTAQAMVASAFTAPHVTEWITVDATRSMKLVEQAAA